MKTCSLMRVALFAGVGLGLCPVPAVRAQSTDNARVVRLSLAEGQVLFSPAGSNVWEAAPANLPLQEGDTLATQDGRAEIEFENGATGYLAENSVLQFTRLGTSGGVRATELTLTQGAGTFDASLSSQDTFRVQALTFNVTIPERAEFRLDGFLDGATVQVYDGEVSVSTTKGSTNLEQGQSVAVREKDFQDMSVGSLPTAEDAFDEWVTEQGEMIRAGNKNTLSYINSPNVYGLSDLSRYGTWVNIAGFGFSWRPFSAGFTWTPYFNGKWILNPTLGWIWVSGEPWGWVPFHFGSWLLSPDLGWVWVPGGPTGLRQWEPARVNWVNAGDRIGWVAMSPNDRAGAPANAAHGVITRSGRSAGNGIENNEIMTGKDLRTLTPVKQPPPEFALRPAPITPRSGAQSASQLPPRTPKENRSIALDSTAHTDISRDGKNGIDRILPVTGKSAPVAPAAIMPRVNSLTEVPRVTLPRSPSGSRTDRDLMRSPYLTPPAPRGNLPGNRTFPPRPTSNAPLSTQPHPVGPPPMARPLGIPGQATPAAIRAPTPPPAIPRPVTPTPAPAPSPAQHTTPAPAGTSARPVTQSPASAAPADRR